MFTFNVFILSSVFRYSVLGVEANIQNRKLFAYVNFNKTQPELHIEIALHAHSHMEL